MITPRWMVLGTIALAAYVMMPRPASAGYPACPTAGAPLNINVDNQTGSPVAVTFSGSRVAPACTSHYPDLPTSYSSSNITCTAGGTPPCMCTAVKGSTTCATVSGLNPGTWAHYIHVGPQQQGTQTVLIGNDPGGMSNSVSWTAFKSVITVDSIGDGSGNCSLAGQCTLRQAIANANSAASPALVQFSPTVFPAGTQTTVTLSNTASLPISGYRMMVDGTDLNGNPAFVGNPYALTTPTFSRVVELASSGSGFGFSGQLATLSGLFIQRPALTQQPPAGQPGDPVFLSDGSSQNTVVNVKIDGGGSGLGTKTAGQDCIGTGVSAGTNFSNANVVTNCELEFCIDKGVKSVRGSYVTVQDSWVHQSIGGGIQATESGNLQVYHNVVEHAGSNASSVVYSGASGLASHGRYGTSTTPSVLNTDGNITRWNALSGLRADLTYSTASSKNDFACANLNGISILAGAGLTGSTVTVRGSTFVYNSSDGAVVGDSQSSGNFGAGTGANCTQVADPGNNALTQNTSHDFENDSGAPMQAVCNQWQGCPTNSSCSPRIYQNPGSVNYTPWQAYEQVNPSILGVSPKKSGAGDIVHITGSGFNAVDTYPSGGSCSTQLNSCDSSGNPINGICLTLTIPNTTFKNTPSVYSVTPTDIAFQSPGCTQPTTVTVKQTGYGGTPPTWTICTNE